MGVPYADAKRQREAVRLATRRYRARRRAAAEPKAAARPEALIGWLAGLPVTQGEGAGGRLPVLPWERRFVAALLTDGVSDAALSLGRANGKSTLVAAVAAAFVAGPMVRPRAEVVVCASSFMQARIVFEHTRAFLGEALADRDRWRVWDSASAAMIEDRDTGARLRCIGCDPRRAHGLAPALVLADEPAQWPAGTSEAMRAALQTARGKVPGGGRFVALGTRPADSGHWFSVMLDGGADVAHSYAAGPDDPIDDPATWLKANPSMPAMPALRQALEREAQRAKVDSMAAAAFRALRLNLGVADTTEALLLDAGVWRSLVERAVPPEAAGPYALGLDLGGAAAMSAAAGYWPRTGRLDALAMFAGEPNLARRGTHDAVGGLYQTMADRGELIVTPGRVVQPAALLEAVRDRWGMPAVIVADRYREAELRQALDDVRYPATALLFRGMGYRDGADDVRRFRAKILSGNVQAGRSLLLTFAMAEARTVSDPAGNAKLSKGHEGGRRSRARDDAAAAAILAVAAGSRGVNSRPAIKRVTFV